MNLYSAYTVILAGQLPYILSYVVYVYGSGQQDNIKKR